MKILVAFSVLLFFHFSCADSAEKKNDDHLEKLNNLTKLDVKMGPIKPGDWLETHPEKGQTFAQYQKTKFVQPNAEKNKIYIRPVGDFLPEEFKIVEYTAAYLQDFFGLPTVLMDQIHDSVVPPASRRILASFEQLHAAYVLDSILYPQVPEDAIVVIGITNKDLYPQDSWAFVFGLAYPTKRISVSSMFRYVEDSLTAGNYHLCLDKMIKTTAHEVAHTFGLKHCINATCVMNGTNGLHESIRRPNHLCSECTKKLYYNLHFNLLERNRKMNAFFMLHHLPKEVEYYNKEKSLMQ
ncbi:MAG: archaemetzincin [Flavobacteriales bacterium]